jgi:hypothetical protein
MLNLKNIIASMAVLVVMTAHAATELTIVVAGSKTGTYTLASNMLSSDSKNQLTNGINISLIQPGNPCKGYEAASQMPSTETFLVPIENLISENAVATNDPLCKVPSTATAVPVFTEFQPLYLVVRKGISIDDFKTKKFNVGYSVDVQLEKSWHLQMNKAFKQDHQYVPYKGSGSLLKGILAKDVDVAWTTQTRINQLLKTEPDSFVVLAASATSSDSDAPLLSEVLGDSKLDRAFVTTWWLMNDKNNVSKDVVATLNSLYTSGKGEWGNWALTNKKQFNFDKDQQLKMQRQGSWVK